MGKFGTMAKSKNHTSHNQGHKNHRNGIYKPKKQRYTGNHMVNQKLVRNTRRARKFDKSIKKSVNTMKKIQVRRDMKKQVMDRIKAARIAKVTGGKPSAPVKEDKGAKKPAPTKGKK